MHLVSTDFPEPLAPIIKFIVNPLLNKKYADIMIYVIKNKSIDV